MWWGDLPRDAQSAQRTHHLVCCVEEWPHFFTSTRYLNVVHKQRGPIEIPVDIARKAPFCSDTASTNTAGSRCMRTRILPRSHLSISRTSLSSHLANICSAQSQSLSGFAACHGLGAAADRCLKPHALQEMGGCLCRDALLAKTRCRLHRRFASVLLFPCGCVPGHVHVSTAMIRSIRS